MPKIMAPRRTHRCAAPGCDKQVPMNMLMCLAHWRRLPKPIRDAIWETYRAGTSAGTHPTSEYIKNVRAAQAHLKG